MRFSPPPVTLRQLQYVVAVADTASFRGAAARCAVSQPALSAQVAEAEGALGVRLFERDRRGVLVTAAGRDLVERARQLLLQSEELVQAAARYVDPLAGTMRLGVIPTMAPYLLPAAAPALREAFPRLQLIWVEEKTETLALALQRGELEGALLALEAEIGDVDHEVLCRDPFLLAAPRESPWAKGGTPVRLDRLREERLLLLEEGHCLREQALAFCAERVREAPGFRATSLPTLVQMVGAGLGVTLLPRLAAGVEAQRADLVLRPFVRPAPYRTLALVWRRRSPLEGALRSVAATIRAHLPASEPA